MRLATRRLLDRAFSSMGFIAIAIMAAAVLIVLVPIYRKGSGAFVFRATVEHRRLMVEKFDQGDPDALAVELAVVEAARKPAFDMLETFRKELEDMPSRARRQHKANVRELEELVRELFGPLPGESLPVMPRMQYGQTRWDRAQVKLDLILNVESWDYSDPSGMGRLVTSPRVAQFTGTALEPFFGYVEEHIEDMMQPRVTFYWQFLTNKPLDAHIFGGIWPEFLGTIYLTLGAMFFAVPLGIIAAIYFSEYSQEGRLVGFLRTCVSTLAGVPSIVFGLFGLAFFINTIRVSPSKSVLAGSLTLGLLVLPTVIRASEEAIRAVPQTYKEAALGLGAGRWHTVVTVILPAALPGILTGVVISMGRAAGETAPIIFTAAVSVGRALNNPLHALSKPTPALSWNIYNLCTEHEAVDEIRHVQFGMVMTLVSIVLLLNLSAIIVRARISRKLKG